MNIYPDTPEDKTNRRAKLIENNLLSSIRKRYQISQEKIKAGIVSVVQVIVF
jgi:hypothetical protein